MKFHADCKTVISQSGKATATTSKMIKTNGDGNVPDYSAPQKTCSLNLFVLPYVIPMPENAGAIVYTPRERDTQKNEIIVDNDTPQCFPLFGNGG